MRKRKNVLFLAILVALLFGNQASANEDLEAAERWFESHEYREAIRHLRKVIKKEPSNTRAWFLLGDSYRYLEKQKKAIKAYRTTIGLHPSHKGALLGLGISYAASGQHPEAIVVLTRLTEIDPSNASAHFYLGVSYEAVRSIGLAFEQYKTLKPLDKKLADRLYHIIFW